LPEHPPGWTNRPRQVTGVASANTVGKEFSGVLDVN
jgi:hypothetical protein